MFQAEIDRLQKEGSKLLEEEITRMRKEIWELHNLPQKQTDTNANYRIKIKWKAAGDDSQNGGYNYDTLYRILYKVYLLLFYLDYKKIHKKTSNSYFM